MNQPNEIGTQKELGLITDCSNTDCDSEGDSV